MAAIQAAIPVARLWETEGLSSAAGGLFARGRHTIETGGSRRAE